MRKIKPQKIASLCSNCLTPMLISSSGFKKVWTCKNKAECGGKDIDY